MVSNDNSANVQLAAEVQRLSDEVEDLRNEESRARTENRPTANPNASLTPNSPALAAIFIFQDGRRISVQNYAIAGQTLWIFNEQTARKMSLADLDTSTTEQANAANGVDIHFPAAPAKK